MDLDKIKKRVSTQVSIYSDNYSDLMALIAEVERLKAGNRELKLDAIAAESVKYHLGENGLIREATLRKALEELKEEFKHGITNFPWLISIVDKALKGDE